MQTFLPYQDFARSAQVLDMRRLGKQRVEVLQILTTLLTGRKAWSNHPAVRMWKGHEDTLAHYGLIVCREWQGRGFKDTCHDKILDMSGDIHWDSGPPWLTDEFCRAHQSNLIRKMPEHYRPLWPDVPDDLEYIWPV